MALKQSNAALGKVPIAYPSCAGETVTQRFSFTAAANIAANDIIELAPIPPGVRVVDIVIDSDDLDTGTPAILLNVGIMSGSWGSNDSARTCGAEFFSGVDVAKAGGVARPTLASAYRQASDDTERSIGVKIATAAAAGAAGEIGLTVTYAG